MAATIVDRLLASDEPSVRWKVRTHVLQEDVDSRAMRRLGEEIRVSARVRRLLDGHETLRPGTYTKWQGAHWVLQSLADLGYPPGDETLAPLRDQVLRNWLARPYFRDRVVDGRHRRCGSQHGGALLAVVRLGLDDGRCAALVERLRVWQWPDGGWNCDRTPDAGSSSVYETLLPMRGLAAFAAAGDDPSAASLADKAAEVLLERRLLYRRTNGRLIRGEWASLHYPVYWKYDVLAGLNGLAEAGHIDDPRCRDALELLETKRLPDGGWPAEGRFWKGGTGPGTSYEHVSWGPVSKRRTNEWVTADALAVRAAAGIMPA